MTNQEAGAALPITKRLRGVSVTLARSLPETAASRCAEAADTIEELVEVLTNAKYGLELLLREVKHGCGDGGVPPWLRSSVERAQDELRRIDALLAKLEGDA